MQSVIVHGLLSSISKIQSLSESLSRQYTPEMPFCNDISFILDSSFQKFAKCIGFSSVSCLRSELPPFVTKDALAFHPKIDA